MRPEEDLLSHVLRVLVVTHDPQHDTEDGGMERGDQSRERGSLTPPCGYP